MSKDLESKLLEFRLHTLLIRDMLESISERDLAMSPVKGGGTFGKQFRHMLDNMRCYRDALESGSLDFNRTDINHALEDDRQQLLSEFEGLYISIDEFFSNLEHGRERMKYVDGSAVTRYLGDDFIKLSPSRILSLIVEHLVFHEGQLTLYFRALERPFPPSWMFWGLR